jgi:hypothetical protein
MNRAIFTRAPHMLTRNRIQPALISSPFTRRYNNTDHKPDTANDEQSGKERAFSKVKRFFKTYGIPGIAVHFTIYFMTLAGLYVALDKKKINIGRAVNWIKKLGLGAWVDLDKIEEKKRATNFAVAWVLAKPTEPVRFMLTLAITPYVVRALKWYK